MYVSFNDSLLTDYIKVLDVKRSILPTRINNTIKIPKNYGEFYTGFEYGSRSIEVEFVLKAASNTEYVQYVRTLANMLDVKKPSKLILGDEENKYYYAVLDGDTELDQILSNGMGSLKFICFNPLAYASVPKVFDADANKITTVINDGTAPTQPIVNVAFSKDAHFLQCTYYTGETVLVGQRPSYDKPTAATNSVAMYDNCELLTNWLAPGNVLDSGREILGNAVINTGGYGIVCANYGASTLGWHGAALRRNIGSALTEFDVSIKMEHNSWGTTTGGNSTTQPSNGSTYKCKANPRLRIRSGRSTTTSILGYIPDKAEVTVTEISKGWGKVTYGGKTGYISMDYMEFIKTSSGGSAPVVTGGENRVGRIEVYGFSSEGNKLFKFILRDSEQYFEYTQPEIEIGSTLILDDKSECPKPQKANVKDDDGTLVATDVASGRHGDWNEFSGIFNIKRTLNSKGKYEWYAAVSKYQDGKTVKTINTNTLSSDSYPGQALSHIVIWFGQYKDQPVVDTMGITEVVVKSLAPPPTVSSNEVIFTNGDELELNFEENHIYLNGKSFMSKLDIGSEFFDLIGGTSQFICKSDDPNIDVITTITEKWL